MNLSEIKKRLVQAFESGKQEFLEKLQQIPPSSEIKKQLVQAFLEDVERTKTDIKEIITMPPIQTKITMVGPSGTGKTCYMVGMIIIMQHLGINGLKITPVDLTQGQLLEEQWDIMQGQTGADRWPPGSVVPTQYIFNYSHAFQTFAKFDWLDYRGGGLDDPQERPDLVNTICTSDCVFLCLSAEHLANGLNLQAARKAKLATMNTIMVELATKINATPQNPFPVAIVVTKADLLANFNGTIQQNFADSIKPYFDALFQSNSPWLTAIIPVSLGAELAQNPDSGKIEPMGVHLPVSFGVLCQLIKERGRQGQPQGGFGFLQKILGINSAQMAQLDERIKQLNKEFVDLQIPIYAGDRRITSLIQ
jgi:hypothetical protein